MLNKVVRNILNAKTRFFGIFCFVIQSHTNVSSFFDSSFFILWKLVDFQFRSKICSKITSFYLFINYS